MAIDYPREMWERKEIIFLVFPHIALSSLHPSMCPFPCSSWICPGCFLSVKSDSLLLSPFFPLPIVSKDHQHPILRQLGAIRGGRSLSHPRHQGLLSNVVCPHENNLSLLKPSGLGRKGHWDVTLHWGNTRLTKPWMICSPGFVPWPTSLVLLLSFLLLVSIKVLHVLLSLFSYTNTFEVLYYIKEKVATGFSHGHKNTCSFCFLVHGRSVLTVFLLFSEKVSLRHWACM